MFYSKVKVTKNEFNFYFHFCKQRDCVDPSKIVLGICVTPNIRHLLLLLYHHTSLLLLLLLLGLMMKSFSLSHYVFAWWKRLILLFSWECVITWKNVYGRWVILLHRVTLFQMPIFCSEKTIKPKSGPIHSTWKWHLDKGC
jgi:hypothetical protein